MQYDEGLAKLGSRARLATAVLWAFVAVAALTGFGEVLVATGTLDIAADTGALALTIGVAYLAYTPVVVASVIVVSMWIYRAHANLRDANVEGLEFAPGWAVGWYFVPIANLFMPFQAMRELWNSSHGEVNTFGGEAPPAVKLWWAAWIIGTIASNLGMRILLIDEGGSGSTTVGNAIGATGTAFLVLASLLLVRLIQGVTQAQRGGITAVGVFA